MSDKRSFLKLIRTLESSNNPHVQHRTIASGLHEGDTAIGEAGLMPNTAKEMANRRALSGQANQADKLVLSSDNPTVQAMLQSNPDLRSGYVNDLAGLVMNKTNNDPTLASTAWLYGHNRSPEQLQDIINNHPEYNARINNAINNLHLMSEKPTYNIPALQEAEALSERPKVYPYSKLRSVLK